MYYLDCSDDKGGAKRSAQLQKTISEILAIYYPLAGRYIDEKYLIHCNDKGAEYLEAHVSGGLSDFIKRTEFEAELRNRLVPYIFQPPDNPLLAIQFNMFECGGVAIGISMTHTIADGFTGYTFINALANACRIGNSDQVRPPSFELGSICPPRDMRPSSTLRYPSSEVKIVTRSLLFNGPAISRLKAIANANCNDQELLKREPKAVELVAALIWKALISVSKVIHGRLRPSVLVLPYNLRRKSTIVSENCCGNLVRVAAEEFIPNNDGKEVQLHDLVGHFRKTVRTGFADCAKATNAEELFLMTTNAVKKLQECYNNKEVDVVSINNLHGFPLYENDFGWGKPNWIQSAFYPVEFMSLLESRDGKGIEAWINLEENKMLLLLKNLDIIAFTGHGISKL